jgi:carbon storage regulator
MLVLSRKTGERIHIGNNITIEVRRVAGNRVTLALDAPRDVRILRGELEKAAREFDGPELEEPQPAAPFVITHHRFSVVDGTPVELSRDFVI